MGEAIYGSATDGNRAREPPGSARPTNMLVGVGVKGLTPALPPIADRIADIAEGPSGANSFSTLALQCRSNFGRGVPRPAIAATTSNQNGSTPKPGIASRANPGNSSHWRPSTMKSSSAQITG